MIYRLLILEQAISHMIPKINEFKAKNNEFLLYHNGLWLMRMRLDVNEYKPFKKKLKEKYISIGIEMMQKILK